MKFSYKTLVVSLFFILLVSSSVLARSTMKVPAVDANGKGVLTSISADIEPGTGKIFVDIQPFFRKNPSVKQECSVCSCIAKQC